MISPLYIYKSSLIQYMASVTKMATCISTKGTKSGWCVSHISPWCQRVVTATLWIGSYHHLTPMWRDIDLHRERYSQDELSNIRRSHNAVSTMGHRLRHWPIVKTTLGQGLRRICPLPGCVPSPEVTWRHSNFDRYGQVHQQTRRSE